MRIRVYKMEGLNVAIFIEPAPGKKRPPIYLPEVPPERVKELVAAELEKLAVQVP